LDLSGRRFPKEALVYIMRKTILITLLFLGMFGFIKAQQEPMFTQYMFNSLSFNPAYAGSHEYMSIRLLYRNQWVDFDGAPKTQTFTIHSPVNDRIGLGLSVFNDEIGATGSTGANFSYAYRFLVGSGKLSLGLQGGVTNWRADFNQLKFRDPIDGDIAFNDISDVQWLPNFGAGIFYYSKLWYAGFSVPRLLENNLRGNQSTNVSQSARLRRHYYLHAGLALPLAGDDLIFKPSFIIKNVGLFSSFSSNNQNLFEIGAPTEIDIDASLLFFDTFWVGLSFRSAFEAVTETSSVDSVDAWFSVQLSNGIRVGAAYDQTLTKIGQPSFELLLGYDFDYEVKRLNTPRYF